MKTFLRATVIAALIGAIVFVVVQVIVGSGYGTNVITTYIGGRIVEEGDYSSTLAQPVGWAVHLAVSFSYALLFGVIFAVLKRKPGPTFLAALLLGWVTTLITVPAINATVSLLAGQGFPEELGGLNTTTDLPLWNHFGFFLIAWLVFLTALRRAKKKA